MFVGTNAAATGARQTATTRYITENFDSFSHGGGEARTLPLRRFNFAMT